MKKYVIMTSMLSNMGGAQMYIRNKILYLREHGWDASIIAGRAENILIPELREFKETVPELQFNSFLFSTRVRQRTINILEKQIADAKYSEIFIESTSIEVSTWAELVAKKIGATHLIYLLQEHNNVNNKLLQEFLVFKYHRHELAGISPKSLAAMFKTFYPLGELESYSLSASCNNVEADVECELLDKIDRSRFDYIVGAFSRMDKPYVLHAVEDFCNYASLCPPKRFLFIWIGDAPAGSQVPSKVKRMVDVLPNVELLLIGYIFPVPYKLLEFCDAFISSAGSCKPCMRSGVPTISYDGNDFKPIGIVGRTTKNSLFRDKDELPLKLSDLLDDILVSKKYPKLQPKYRSGIPDFKKHMVFLDEMDHKKEYFDVNKIILETRLEKKVALGLAILGSRGYTWFHQIKAK